MGRVIFGFGKAGSGSGSGISSADTTTIASKVLSGKTYLGADTKDGIGTGTMPTQHGISEYINCGDIYTIPEGYYNPGNMIFANSLASQTPGDVTAGDILEDKTAYVNGGEVTGTMPENGNVSVTLNAGSAYAIPRGHHSGSGVVQANSLASQTAANAPANAIVSGYSGYVNGVKVNGSIPNRGQGQWGNFGWSGDYIAINQLPAGAYYKNGADWAPEARINTTTLFNSLGIVPGNIRNGVTIGNVTGNFQGWVDNEITYYQYGAFYNGLSGAYNIHKGSVNGSPASVDFLSDNIQVRNPYSKTIKCYGYIIFTPSVNMTGFTKLGMEVSVTPRYPGDANRIAVVDLLICNSISGTDVNGTIETKKYATYINDYNTTPRKTIVGTLNTAPSGNKYFCIYYYLYQYDYFNIYRIFLQK